MAISRGPKLVTNGLVLALDPSDDNSFAAQNLPIKNGLILWLDAADDDSFVYSSGTVVSQWRDKSGLNNHVAQSTVASQPNRNVVKNSRKSVYFDGGDTLFNSGNVFPSNTTDYTKIAVVYQTSTATTGNVIGSRTGDSGSSYAHTVYFGGLNFRMWHSADIVTSSISLSLNTLGIISATYVNSSGLGSVFLNGTASGTGTAANRNIVQNIEIGGLFGGNNFTGEICEALVFSRILSATELKQVHTYLGQKWGVLNTDRTVFNLADYSKSGLLGNGSTSNMPLYDYYNKGAFKFFASNKYIKLGNNTSVNQFAVDFTISLWAMATAENSNYGNLIGDYYTAGTQTNNEWQIMMNNSSAFLNVYRHGTGYIINNTSSGFSANTWINVVLTRIGSAITLYANNTVIATATNSSVFGSATGSVNIGIDGNNVAEPFSGLISNVLIYSKGLTATEVAQNYNAQKSRFTNTIVQQGLVLNLDAGNNYSYAGSGTIWYDVSGNNYNSALNGSLTFSDNSISLGSSTNITNYISVPASSLSGLTSWTIQMWLNINASNAIESFLTCGEGNNFLWFFEGRSTLAFQNTGSSAISYPTAIGEWFLFTATGTGGSISVYKNGLSLGSFANTTTITISSSIGIILGQEMDNNTTGGFDATQAFLGKYGSVSFYNRVLSASEVLQNYNATKGRFGL